MTSLLYGTRREFDPPQVAESEQDVRAGFAESFTASLDRFVSEDWSIAENRNWSRYMEEQQKAAQELVGYRGAMPYKAQGFPWYDDVVRLVDEGQYSIQDGEIVASSREAGRLMAVAGKGNVEGVLYRRKLKQQFPDRFLSDEEILGKIKEDTKAIRDRAQDVGSRSDALPQILGTVAGAVSDPLVLATLPIGAEGVTARGITAALGVAARVGAKEAAIAAAVEAVIQAQVYQFKQDIESPFTKLDAIFNIVSAGAGAGLLRGAGSLTVDAIGALERRLANREFQQLMEEAGFSARDVEQIREEAKARIETQPRGVDLETHSDLVDASIRAMDEGRLPEVDLPVARAATEEVETLAARRFLDDRIAELLPEAGNRLSLGDRKLLESEVRDLEFRLAQVDSPERLAELVEARKAEGMTGRKAKAEAAKDQAKEVKEIRERLDNVVAKRMADDKARAAEAEVSRLEQKRRESPVKAARDLGFKEPERVVKALDEAVAEVAARARPSRSPETADMKATAERVSQVAPPKPKVDKGNVPPAMRGEPRAEAPKAEAPKAEAEAPQTPQVVDELGDTQVSVDTNPDGTPATKTLKQVIDDADAELRGLDAVEACLNG